MSPPGPPLGLGAQQVLLGDHLEDGADVLGHAAVDEDQALLELPSRLGRCVLRAQDAMRRQEPAAADAEFRIALAGQDAGDQLHPGPDAARVLPAAAGAAQPLAEDRPGERPGAAPPRAAARRADRAWPVARMQAETRAASSVVETASREPFGMSLTLLTISSPRPGPTTRASRSARLCPEPSMPGGTMPDGDDRRLEQAEVVLGEVEDLGQAGDVGGGAQVDAGQAEDRLVDDAQVGLDRRARSGVAAVDAEVDGDVEHPGALGVIHPQEEDVAPAAVGEVHADRRPLAQDRVGPVGVLGEQLAAAPAADGRPGGRCGTSTGCRAPSARCAGPGRPASGRRGAGRPRPARCETPSLGPSAAWTARNASMASSKRRASRCSNPRNGMRPRRTAGWSPRPRAAREVEAVDGVEEEQRPDALVEVVAPRAGRRRARRTRPGARGARSPSQAASSDRFRRAGSVGGDEAGQHRVRAARSSTSMESTSSRSRPDRASASWAESRPYLTPMS